MHGPFCLKEFDLNLLSGKLVSNLFSDVFFLARNWIVNHCNRFIVYRFFNLDRTAMIFYQFLEFFDLIEVWNSLFALGTYRRRAITFSCRFIWASLTSGSRLLLLLFSFKLLIKLFHSEIVEGIDFIVLLINLEW